MELLIREVIVFVVVSAIYCFGGVHILCADTCNNYAAEAGIATIYHDMLIACKEIKEEDFFFLLVLHYMCLCAAMYVKFCLFEMLKCFVCLSIVTYSDKRVTKSLGRSRDNWIKHYPGVTLSSCL